MAHSLTVGSNNSDFNWHPYSPSTLSRHCRYFAIIYPFRPLLWLKQHKFAFVAAIWGIGFLVASPLLVVNRVIPLVRTVPSNVVHYYDCKEQWGDEINKAYTIFLFLATFLVPICALIFVYSRICYHLWRNAVAPGNPDQQRDKVVIDRNMKVSTPSQKTKRGSIY